MSTFLQLCQRVASESGTVVGTGQPSAVNTTDPRLAKIVRWTNDAWRQIQNVHEGWLWKRSSFSGPTVAGQREYTGVQMGVASRFGEFLYSGKKDERRYSIYLTATGVADEQPLQFQPYDWFWSNNMRGTQTNDRPAYFTITPEGKISFHPIPDAVYTVRGPYLKDVQELTADADTPEMPARFHDIIADVALRMLGTHDESPFQLQLWQLRQFEKWPSLEQSQLPRDTMSWPKALA